MKHHQKTEGANDEWLTPLAILRPLGVFDLDPCSPSVRPWSTAIRHISLPDDGLSAEWIGRVWCNPPFNRYVRPRWMRRMSDHGNGVMLVPAATETEAFEAFIWRRAEAICFIKTRPHFHYVDGRRASFNSGAAMCLAAYGKHNAAALEAASLGRTIIL